MRVRSEYYPESNSVFVDKIYVAPIAPIYLGLLRSSFKPLRIQILLLVRNIAHLMVSIAVSILQET
ncbi:MAG: hypothetical protein FKGGLIKP_00775 [Sodalis sp. Fse]|nr:MAG: hypothetical protein FKGGLIKP_00775 [Sodalis sp. Fse]